MWHPLVIFVGTENSQNRSESQPLSKRGASSSLCLTKCLITYFSYATGLLFISPLGDLVKRRPLLLLLCSISASLTVGLAVTRSFVVFKILCYLVGVATMAPQILDWLESQRADGTPEDLTHSQEKSDRRLRRERQPQILLHFRPQPDSSVERLLSPQSGILRERRKPTNHR